MQHLRRCGLSRKRLVAFAAKLGACFATTCCYTGTPDFSGFAACFVPSHSRPKAQKKPSYQPAVVL